MQESNAKIPAQNSYVSISPYVGIIQIRFRVKASAYSQPAYASTPFSFFATFFIILIYAEIAIVYFTITK